VYLQRRFAECPIQASLGVLGRKWTMLIIRDIGFRRVDRFNRLLESIPGLTPRVLSMRLKELEKDGIIECVEDSKSPMVVRWELTQKGRDALPILISLVAYGSKWYADRAFEDKTPRTLREIFRPEARQTSREILQSISV
jgi:DNA-binding HxlR family transcriptional regulator